MKMQDVSFRTIGDFLDFLPEDELRITEALRSIVLDCLPLAKERLAYNVLHYCMDRSVCFIWPASILWGTAKTYEGVRLGFSHANMLSDSDLYLERGNRKQVYWKDFQNLRDIQLEKIRPLLFEAAILDGIHKNRNEQKQN